MNINQIKYVLAVADSSSMRAAATMLYITQPALSASIRELEEEIGVKIFTRSNKGIRVTEEGREFLVHAKKLMAQYEILEDRYLSAVDNREKFSVSTQHYNLAIRSFTNVVRKVKPEKYMFSIHETRTSEVLQNVRDLKSEVGVLSYSESNADVLRKLIKEYQLVFVPLMKREACVYVWENHPLANRKSVSLEELKDYPYVSFDQSGDSRFYLTEEAMADHEADRMIRSDDRATSMEIVAELQGYSIGSGMLSGEEATLQGLVSIALEEKDTLTIGYIIRKDSVLSEYGKMYLEELEKYREL